MQTTCKSFTNSTPMSAGRLIEPARARARMAWLFDRRGEGAVPPRPADGLRLCDLTDTEISEKLPVHLRYLPDTIAA